jgi:hypothetical protein
VVEQLPRRPRPLMPGRMAEVRAQLGDREIGAPGGRGVLLEDSR